MRDILFRARRLNTDIWAYGFLVNYWEGNENHWHIVEENTSYKINIHTIGQYSGLQDINGTKMFEGDIIERDVQAERVKKQIIFKNGSFRACNSKGSSATEENNLCAQKVYGCNMVVIGNMIDHPQRLTDDYTIPIGEKKPHEKPQKSDSSSVRLTPKVPWGLEKFKMRLEETERGIADLNNGINAMNKQINQCKKMKDILSNQISKRSKYKNLLMKNILENINQGENPEPSVATESASSTKAD